MSHPTQPSQPQSPYQQPSVGATATATPSEPRAARHAERERRRVERWRRRAERPPHFERFRNPRATRMLIAAYLGGMAVALAAMPVTLAVRHDYGRDNVDSTFLVVYLVGMLVSCIAWTVLRCTIDIKDSAPDAALDEYEVEVLSRWRRIGFQALQWITLVVAFAIAMIVGWIPDDFPFDTTLLIAGVTMLLVVTVCSTLPAVGYALTFNTSADPAPEPVD
ncbi:hypothetical protein [Corynebacterium frankenforstense]